MDESGNVAKFSFCSVGDSGDTAVEIIASGGPGLPASYVSADCEHMPKEGGVDPSVSSGSMISSIEAGPSGLVLNTPSADVVASGGVEELQTFLNNFNSELAAESQQHATVRLVQPPSITTASSSSYTIYEAAAPTTATLVYEGDALPNGMGQSSGLQIVDFAGSANLAGNGGMFKDGSITVGDSRGGEVLILPHTIPQHFQLPPDCHIAASGCDAGTATIIGGGVQLASTVVQDVQNNMVVSNHQPVFQEQPPQQLLIPIDCSEALVNGNQIPQGSTVLLPVIPTVLPNGSIEVRIAGQAITLQPTISVTEAPVRPTVEPLPVVVQPPQQQQILVIVGGNPPDNTSNQPAHESPRKVPIARMRPVKKKAAAARTRTASSTSNLIANVSSDSIEALPVGTPSIGEKKAGDASSIDQPTSEADGDTSYASIVRPGEKAKKSAAENGKPGAESSKRTVFQCQYCDYTNVKKYLLLRHMKSHSEDRPHVCHVCEKRFKTSNSLQNHVNTHTGFRPHQCHGCNATFTTSGEMVRHIRYKHTQEKPHKCPNCDYASVELSKLKRHLRSHTGERPFQCRKCAYASPDMYKLKRHMRVHTGEKPYECDICLQRFTQSNSLKAHKMIHTGNKPVYQCEFCSSSCGRKTDLKIHIQKLHTTADRPLLCRKCGKSFPDRYSLKQHQRIHDGERCFSCTYDRCTYSAFTQRHLDVHMMMHQGEKPFECPVESCTHAFRQRTALKRHVETKHGSSVPLPDQASVKREKSFQCGECNKLFRNRTALFKHGERHQLAANGVTEDGRQLRSSKEEAHSPNDERPTMSVIFSESETEESAIEDSSEDEAKVQDVSTSSVRLYKCSYCDESFRQPVQLEHHCQLEHIGADDHVNPENVIYVPFDAIGTSAVRRSAEESEDGNRLEVAAPPCDTEDSKRQKRKSDDDTAEIKAKEQGRPLNRSATKRSRLESAIAARTSAATLAMELEQRRRKEVANCFGFTEMDQEAGDPQAIEALPVEASSSAPMDGQQPQFESMHALLAATGFETTGEPDSGDEKSNDDMEKETAVGQMPR